MQGEEVIHDAMHINDGGAQDHEYLDEVKKKILGMATLRSEQPISEYQMMAAAAFVDGFVSAFQDGMDSEDLKDITEKALIEVEIIEGEVLELLPDVCRQLAYEIRTYYGGSAINTFLNEAGVKR